MSRSITFHLKSVAEEEKARQEEAARRQALGKAKLDDIRSGRDAERELRVLGAKRRYEFLPRSYAVGSLITHAQEGGCAGSGSSPRRAI